MSLKKQMHSLLKILKTIYIKILNYDTSQFFLAKITLAIAYRVNIKRWKIQKSLT